MLWPYGPKEFQVIAGGKHLIELKMPSRGTIMSVNLHELGGAADGEFEIYDSYAAAAAVADTPATDAYYDVSASNYSSSRSSNSSGVITGGEPGVHRVLQGTGTIAAGVYEASNMARMYQNRDGNYSNPVRRLWGIITTAGTGVRIYNLSMMIALPDFAS